jgi:hypothetical protein
MLDGMKALQHDQSWRTSGTMYSCELHFELRRLPDVAARAHGA